MMQGDPEYNFYQVKYTFELEFLALMVRNKLKYVLRFFFVITCVSVLLNSSAIGSKVLVAMQ